MTARIEAQIERFAPGFGDLVLARSTETAVDVEKSNANYVGGDITGGAATFRQTLFRPTLRWNPYRTGIDGVYLCSASTAPGGGVHGMCGVYAARSRPPRPLRRAVALPSNDWRATVRAGRRPIMTRARPRPMEAAALVRPVDTIGMGLGPANPDGFLSALGARDDWDDLSSAVPCC